MTPDEQLAARMTGEFLAFLGAVHTVRSAVPEGTPEPPEVAEFIERMDRTAEEMRAARQTPDP